MRDCLVCAEIIYRNKDLLKEWEHCVCRTENNELDRSRAGNYKDRAGQEGGTALQGHDVQHQV